jgi:hypothetical protein
MTSSGMKILVLAETPAVVSVGKIAAGVVVSVVDEKTFLDQRIQ